MGKRLDLEKTPFQVFDRRYTVTNLALSRSSEELSRRRGEPVTRRDVENGLVNVLGLDDILDLLQRDIDTEEILSLIGECDFAPLRPETLCEVRLEESIVPDGIPLSLTEAEVKLKGEIWTIHKYDADPFPSNPHAHNYARALKLHLGNGDLFQNKSRVACGRMPGKHLMKLRHLVLQKNATIVLPPVAF